MQLTFIAHLIWARHDAKCFKLSHFYYIRSRSSIILSSQNREGLSLDNLLKITKPVSPVISLESKQYHSKA